MFKLFSENRNFRSLLFFISFGGVGRGMFSIFMMWAIHATFQNPIYTGIAGFMFSAPLVASVIIGPFVDRWDKIKVLRIVELTKFSAVMLIFLFQVFSYPTVWLLFPAIFAFSIASLFGAPAYTAFLPRVVAGEHLVKANALINITGLTAGLGIMGGLLLLTAREAGFAWIYGINAAVLLITVLLSAFLRYPTVIDEETNGEASAAKTEDESSPLKAYFDELKAGLSFVKAGVMLPLISATVFMGFFSNIAYVNFPRFAEIHLGSASGYVLFSALALTGSMIGSIICRAVEAKYSLAKIFIGGFVVTGIIRILFVQVIPEHRTGGILLFVLYVGFASAILLFYQVVIQKAPPKNLISRVATADTSLSAIATALGALMGGALGTILEVNTVFIIQGASYIVIGMLLCFSKQVRRLPESSELEAQLPAQ